MKWVGYIGWMGQKSNGYKVLVRKPEDIIKMTYM
jgi:hypothetical protein